MYQIKLFTKPFCMDCKKAHNKIEELKTKYDFGIEEFNLNTEEGMAEALYHEVYSVPHFYINERSIEYQGESTFDVVENIIKDKKFELVRG